MTINPLFSIITASFNSGATLKATLESVKNQSLKNVEHIVVDGGSTDGSLDQLKLFESTYNLRWQSEPDRGIADALNKGCRLARGRYILVLGADDTLFDQAVLQRVSEVIKYPESDIYSFPIIYNHPRRGELQCRPKRIIWLNHFKYILLHQGCFVHERVFKKIGFFNTDFAIALDYDFFYRAFKNQCGIRFGSFPVSQMGGEGISSRYEQKKRRLAEYQQVQLQNENNFLWRLMQRFFWLIYLPYKKIC